MPRDTAWAIEIEPENYGAIISEGGREVNKEFLERWVTKFPNGGYFVRDEERRKLNCTFMTMDQFWTIYRRIERTICGPLKGDQVCNGAHFFPIESDEKVDHPPSGLLGF